MKKQFQNRNDHNKAELIGEKYFFPKLSSYLAPLWSILYKVLVSLRITNTGDLPFDINTITSTTGHRGYFFRYILYLFVVKNIKE